MNEHKTLIIGANGQLGTALREKYPGAKTSDIEELDITNQTSVENFDWSGIKTIINAAAYTNVDDAESQEGRVAAWKVNAGAVANLVAVAAQKYMTLVHISTDYVFDGTKSPHTEDESFSPLNVYGASKAAGDLLVSMLPKFYILRTSWVIGEGRNFVRTMLGLAQKDVSPTVVSDQIGRLTFTSELVRTIDYLLTNKAGFGTYNVSNRGEPASWADVAREVFRLGGFNDLSVTDTTTTDYFAGRDDVALRPLNSVLDLSKMEQVGFEFRDWHNELADYIKKELSK